MSTHDNVQWYRGPCAAGCGAEAWAYRTSAGFVGHGRCRSCAGPAFRRLKAENIVFFRALRGPSRAARTLAPRACPRTLPLFPEEAR